MEVTDVYYSESTIKKKKNKTKQIIQILIKLKKKDLLISVNDAATLNE